MLMMRYLYFTLLGALLLVFSCAPAERCMPSKPSWVWEPGENRTWLQTYDTRRWMDEKGITEHHVSCLETDWVLE